jgi:hypothetical protein
MFLSICRKSLTCDWAADKLSDMRIGGLATQPASERGAAVIAVMPDARRQGFRKLSVS